MSYEQLMQHAQEIEATAIKLSTGTGTVPSAQPGQPDYVAHQQKFGVIAAFQPYTNIPQLGAFVPLIKVTHDVKASLSRGPDIKDPASNELIRANPALDTMKDVARALDDWSGNAADEFRRNFIDPFDSYVHNQFALACILEIELVALQALWKSVRTDIDSIAEQTLMALDHLNDCHSQEWSVSWTVAACLAAIAAIPATGGASLTLEFVSAAAWVTAASPPAAPNAPTIGGSTVQGVISSMHSTIRMLGDRIDEQEQAISRVLHQAILAAHADWRPFVAARPALAAATAANVTSRQFLGTPS